MDSNDYAYRLALADTLRKVALHGHKLPCGLRDMGHLQHAAVLLMEDCKYIEKLTPRIMTLGEACGADYAFIEFNRTKVKCTTVYPVSVYIAHDAKSLEIKRIDATDIRMEFEDYGKLFRCWTAEPTEDQREAAKWDA